MTGDTERLFATVDIRASVYIGTDPGINTAYAHELPYEYLVVREAEMLTRTIHGDPAAGIIADHGAFDDFDPDGAIKRELHSAIMPVVVEPRLPMIGDTSTPYTPSLDEVRGRHNANARLEAMTWRQADAQFDRMIAKVRADAWDQAVRAMRYEDGTPVEIVSMVNPYRNEAE